MKGIIKIVICFALIASMLLTSAFAASIKSVDAQPKQIDFTFEASDGATSVTGVAYKATKVNAATEGAVEIDGSFYTLDERIAMGQFKEAVANGVGKLKYAELSMGDTVVLQVGDSESDEADYMVAIVEESLAGGIYVSNSGNDNNKGTQSRPVKTIQKAIEIYESISENYAENITIYVNSGTYYINERIDLNSSHNNMTIEGDNAVFSGGYKIGGGTLAESGDLDGRLSSSVIGKVYKYSLASCNLPSKAQINEMYQDQNYQDFVPELINDGKAMTIARWPNDKYSYTGAVLATNEQTCEHEFETEAPIENITDFENARFDGYISNDYRLTHGQVLGKGENSLRIKSDAIIASEYKCHKNRAYFISNLPELLDAPNEYYIDYDEKMLYYYPENIADVNLTITGISATDINSMFDINDAENITINKITFENTSGTFITGKTLDNITIKNCVFKNAGGRAIRLKEATNTTITQSYFEAMGDASVELLLCGNMEKIEKANNVVSNCEFKDGARVVGTYAPFISAGDYEQAGAERGDEGRTNYNSCGITIENNYFHNHRHTAIMFGGNEIKIKNNIFDNVVTETIDAGAVYSRVNLAYQGNEISNNIFRNIRSNKPKDSNYENMAYAIYLDDLLPCTTMENNVFYNCETPVNLGGGIGHTFKNNLMLNCNMGVNWTNRNLSEASKKNGTNGYLYSVYKSLQKKPDYDEAKWKATYPKFKAIIQSLYDYNHTAAGTEITNYETQTPISQRAAAVHDAVFEDNMMVSKNTSSKNTVQRHNVYGNDEFTRIVEYDEEEDTGVLETNSYYSADESQLSFAGNRLSFTSSATNEIKAYTLPDVSNAGISVQNEIYQMKTGREDNNNYASDRGNDFMIGYRSDISDFNVSTKQMSAGTSQVIPFVQKVNQSFAFAIKATGDITLDFGVGQTFSQSSGIYEYEFDIKNQRVRIFTQDLTTGLWSKLDTKSVVIPQILEAVTISATTDATIENLAMGVLNHNEYRGYYYRDFEDGVDGQLIRNYDENIEARNLWEKPYTAEIVEESNGNKAYFVSGQNYNEDGSWVTSATKVQTFLNFAPIKLSGNRVAVEFKVKADADNTDINLGGRLRVAMVPSGYFKDNPKRNVEVWVAEQRSSGDSLFVGCRRKPLDANPEIGSMNATESAAYKFATTDELKADYVHVRYVLDKDSKRVEVWQWSDSAHLKGWKKVHTTSDYELPDYIDRLNATIDLPSNVNTNGEQVYQGYYFDDIKIYNEKRPFIVDNDVEASSLEYFHRDGAAELLSGTNITIYPDYIAGSRTGAIYGAVFRDDRLNQVKLNSFIWDRQGINYSNLEADDKFVLFRFTGKTTLSPSAPAKELIVK